jgi:YHS domain-containing protein
MLRLVIIAFLIYCLYLAVKGLFGKSGNLTRGRADGLIDEMVQDPYCKTYIPRREAVKRVLGGREILFCSKECADKFESENRS